MKLSRQIRKFMLPLCVAALLLLGWHAAVHLSGSDLFPTPGQVLQGTIQLAQPSTPIAADTPWYRVPFEYLEQSRLVRYIVASLFRVTIGFGLALLIGIPFGLLLGWSTRMFDAFNPIIQVLRPISPIAWIPVAILWFGVDDRAPIFLIFLSSVFLITVASMAAVQNIQLVYVRAARIFGLSQPQLFLRVTLPACLPQILTGVRIALGVAWLVVVAAEMIAVNSGLGFLIIDARNAGKRYDLVLAGMAMIGIIGLVLDLLVRRLEHFDEVRWGYVSR